MIQTGTDRDGHSAQVHTNERTADIHTSIRLDGFYGHWISKRILCGVENLAASSVCSVGKTFVSENATENMIYIYVYEGAAPVAVTFILGEDHTVSATGTFILYDGFTCGSAEEIQSVFSDIAINVSEVAPEK